MSIGSISTFGLIPRSRMFRKFFTILLFLCITAVAIDRAAAQSASLLVSSGSGAPGGTVTLNISLTTNGTLPAALQWDLLYSPSDLSPEAGTFYATGAAAALAGKQATCGMPTSGDIRCIVAGLNTTAIADGVLATVTLQISSTTDTSTQVTLSNLDASDGASTPNAVPITTSGPATITIYQPHRGGPQPTLMQNGVRSVANSALLNSPGSLIYAQGTNLATVTTKPLIASSTPLPTHLVDSLDDVSVTVDGIPAPMYYALPSYVSFQLPWKTDLSTGRATIVVTHNGVASSPQEVLVSKFSPGIFTTTGNGLGLAWAIYALPSKINPKGQLAQATSIGKCPSPLCYVGVPATVGDTLYIYAGGLGPVGPKTMPDGHAPCPLSNKVPGPCPAGFNAINYSTMTKPLIMIGGVEATVTFAGLDPVYPGLYVVYFEIPPGAPKGNAVPIQLSINGVSTDPKNVTIAVQ